MTLTSYERRQIEVARRYSTDPATIARRVGLSVEKVRAFLEGQATVVDNARDVFGLHRNPMTPERRRHLEQVIAGPDPGVNADWWEREHARPARIELGIEPVAPLLFDAIPARTPEEQREDRAWEQRLRRQRHENPTMLPDFEAVFWDDIAAHQDGIEDGRDLIRNAIEVVEATDETNGVVDREHVKPFLRWLEKHGDRLAAEFDRNRNPGGARMRHFPAGTRVQVKEGRWTGQGSRYGTVEIARDRRTIRDYYGTADVPADTDGKVAVRFDDRTLVDIDENALEPAYNDPKPVKRWLDDPVKAQVYWTVRYDPTKTPNTVITGGPHLNVSTAEDRAQYEREVAGFDMTEVLQRAEACIARWGNRVAAEWSYSRMLGQWRDQGDNCNWIRPLSPRQNPGGAVSTSTVQSLLFDRSKYTVAQAKRWAKDNGYYYGNVDAASDGAFHRIRQVDPAGYDRLRTVTFGKGIQAIVGWVKQARKQAPRANPSSGPFSKTEFVSGQEPDPDDAYRHEGFATTIGTTFTIDADELARTLGVQRRVLQDRLRKLTESQAIYALLNGGATGDAVLRSFKAVAKRFVEAEVNDAAGEPGRFKASKVEVSWPENTDHFEAAIHPESLSISYYVEIEVTGDWR